MALTQTIKGFHIAVLAGVVAILGSATACSDLDPVKVKSKCEGPGPLDMRCPQCITLPYAAECPQCQQSAPDETTCLPRVDTLGMSTLPDGGFVDGEVGQSPDGPSAEGGSFGSGGDGGSNTTPSGSKGGTGGSRPASGAGGSGANGGSGPEGPAGNKAPPITSGACRSNADCKAPGAPACLGDGSCAECNVDEHCTGGMQCNLSTNHCVGCVDDNPCKAQGKVCLKRDAMCVQCNVAADCPMETPACTANHECVRCVENTDCPLETPTCSANTCVECERDPDCTRDGKRVCITAEQRCVECKTDPDCRGLSGRSHCLTEENVCVGCLEDADCSDPSASECDKESHMCVSCTGTTHCAQFKGSTSQCAGGKCVVCDRAGGSCGNKACIFSTNTCSTKNRNSVQACDQCASSDECISGYVCVPTSFESTNTGNRCLPNNVDFHGTCPRPFSRLLRKVDSVDGDFQVPILCALPANTSCAALADTIAKKQCMGNNRDCGRGENDGFCSTDEVCTYNCVNPEDCPIPMVCSTDKKQCL